jgi:ubiquinone/menaquinone biosynthesis C-methylase UbiE
VSPIYDREHVREQYRDSINLDARQALHSRFSTNAYGFHRWVFDRLLSSAHSAVLDVGGGPGHLWATEKGRLEASCRVVVTDLSHGMNREAARRIDDDRFRFAVADAQELPFGDDTFDVVVANHMLYHVPDISEAASEFARVLKPGGRLLAATNGSNHLRQLDDLVEDRSFSLGTFDLDVGASKLEPHFRDVTCERYDDAIEVTEAQPVVDYIASMATFWNGSRPQDEIRSEIEAVIEREGVFRIDKEAGLFTGVPR